MAASGNIRTTQIRSGDRSGNGTKVATVTGTLTSGKQLQFDASGNVTASASDIGAGGGGGGFVLIEELVASTSAQLDFNSTITSTYDEYQFEFIDLKPATNNVRLYMRVSTDGGSTFLSTTIYQHASYVWRSGASGAGGNTDAQLNVCFNNVSTDANYPGVCGHMKIFNPLGTTYRKHLTGQFSFFGENSANNNGTVLQGTFMTTSAINSVRFYFETGNIATGTIRSYGFAKS